MDDDGLPAASASGSGDNREGDWAGWLDEDTGTTAGQPAGIPQPPVAQRRTNALDLHQEPPVDPTRGVIDRSGPSAGPIHTGRRPRRRAAADMSADRSKLGALVVAGVIALLFCLVVLTSSRFSHHRPVAQPGTQTATTTAPHQDSSAPVPEAVDPMATDGCVQHPHGGTVVSGTSVGSTASGPDTIFAFERAFYADKSGEKAAAYLSGGSVPASNAHSQWAMNAAELRRGITGGLAPQTRYCVTITGGSDPDRWEVQVATQAPGQALATYTVIMTTTTGPASTVITSFQAI